MRSDICDVEMDDYGVIRITYDRDNIIQSIMYYGFDGEAEDAMGCDWKNAPVKDLANFALEWDL